MLTSKPSKVAKVVICGMKSVGKTAILEQLIYGSVTPDSVSFSRFISIWSNEIFGHYVQFSVLLSFTRSCIRQSRIHTWLVLTLEEDPEIFYAFMIQLVYKALYRYNHQLIFEKKYHHFHVVFCTFEHWIEWSKLFNFWNFLSKWSKWRLLRVCECFTSVSV